MLGFPTIVGGAWGQCAWRYRAQFPSPQKRVMRRMAIRVAKRRMPSFLLRKRTKVKKIEA
jgi:hypothetical protein